MCLDLFAHPFGERHGGVEHGPGKQQHELFAAKATRSIDLAHLVPQDPRELLEDRVARLMAVGVVHALEAVEIAHDAGKGLLEAARMLEHLVEPLLEMPPVVEARQRVGL